MRWVESIGGTKATIERSQKNLATIAAWVARTPWVEFLAKDPSARSCTSICLSIVDPWFTEQSADQKAALAKRIGALLETEGVANDIGSYAEAPPGLRIWGGATAEASDLEALMPWLDWAYAQVKAGTL
jgi:phosphoserine aminotransferase